MISFDRLAPFYDFLKKIVFQNTLDKATNSFIEEIPSSSQILIIGGGTGALLQYFKKTHSITYIELSRKMLSAAKKRSTAAKVQFIYADILLLKLPEKYDCVITPFVLDCFEKEELTGLMNKLTLALRKDGMWLHTDFYPSNSIQKSIVQFMYYFFQKTAGLRLSSIPDFDQLFCNEKYLMKKNVRFKRGLIQSRYYRKIA